MEEGAGGDDGSDIFVGVDDELGSVVLVMLVVDEMRAQGVECDG